MMCARMRTKPDRCVLDDVRSAAQSSAVGALHPSHQLPPDLFPGERFELAQQLERDRVLPTGLSSIAEGCAVDESIDIKLRKAWRKSVAIGPGAINQPARPELFAS